MESIKDKLIKSLERTIDLQEGLIAEQEAEIQRLEIEKAAEQWYPIQNPYNETNAPKYDVTFTTRTGDFDENKKRKSSSS